MNNIIVKVDTKKVACGGDHISKLGHPKVYLTIDDSTNKVTCPYCSTIYSYEVNSKSKLCLN